MPSVQFELRFAAELSTRRVMLSVDGGEPRLYDHDVLRVSPGKHQFVFRCEGCATVTRGISFSEHDTKRKEVELRPARPFAEGARASAVPPAPASPASCGAGGATPAAAKSSARAPAAPRRSSAAEGATPRDKVILGSAAALATTAGLGFVGFGLEGRRAERSLLECAPACSGARIADVKRSYLLANVSLGGGVLVLGAATIWWFGLGRSSQDTRSRPKVARRWSIELGLLSKVTRTF